MSNFCILTHSDFPIRYNGSHESAIATVGIIAHQMDIDPNDIELFFYQDGIREISTGDMGSSIFTTGEEKMILTGQSIFAKTSNRISQKAIVILKVGARKNKLT